MRVFPVFGAAAVAILIGGCGPRQDEPETNLAAAPKASGPFIAERGTTIPAAFQGVYDRRLANCSGPSQERTTITPTELRFHETIAKVRSVLHRLENELEVDADYQGEGEYWRSNRLLTLSQGGARLVIDGDGTSPAMERFRCPAGTR